MGILDNLEAFMEFEDGKSKNTETAWDEEFSFEHKPIKETDNMGREKFWEDMGRSENLALKIFSETVCKDCNND
jgi:hypothetical protein